MKRVVNTEEFSVHDIVVGFDNCHGVRGKIREKRIIKVPLNKDIVLYRVECVDGSMSWCNQLYLKRYDGGFA